ncbi:MAG: hypothetical protein M3Y57_22145 [Acidobacteriota bacterium]|nr:hypothetical protein [Acidobacteriota bacterium]
MENARYLDAKECCYPEREHPDLRALLFHNGDAELYIDVLRVIKRSMPDW